MAEHANTKAFAGSIPALYEKYLVPLIFEPYADDLARRVGALPVRKVLEIAAGTGVVTRRLARSLPVGASIVATDLSQPMIDRAMTVGTARPVEWRQADAMLLPFPDASFDAVVCQFGVMFFSDRARAYQEMRRVLVPGGTLLFNVWDRIEENEFARVTQNALVEMFPQDPPSFLSQTPHGYHDIKRIASDLVSGGFKKTPTFDTMSRRSRAESARVPAVAYCQGTPARNEIEARDAGRLEEATERAERALIGRFGNGFVDGKIQAHVVTVGK